MPRFSLSREEYLQLHVPATASSTALENRAAVVYTFTNPSGKPAAVAFVGKQAKPKWRCFFSTEEQRAREIDRLFRSVQERQARVAAQQAERVAGHRFQPGDTVYTSWGYEQTNVDWYRVTKTYVWLKRLASVQTETGFMSGTCVPGQESTKSEARHFARGQYVHIDRHSDSKWDGRPKQYSTYG